MLAALERRGSMDHSSERFQFTERDLLIQLRSDVKNLSDETRRATSGIAQDIRDHEGRLRVLENFRWYIIGAAGASGFVGALVARAIWH